VVFGWLVVVVSIALSAVGVVIGRFQRWNSWDLLTQPKAVVASTLEWVRSPYLTIWSLGALTVEPEQQVRS
jgi:uncharacterized membrane protein